ncbi:MAG: arylsulfatase [Acidobacteria bacterium]|nr:arylsulfatase [Acidobacteriota bacterium]
MNPIATPLTRRGFLGCTAATFPALSQNRAKPNVIVLMTDDQGYGDLSCHGNPVLKTPAMDRLHAESVRFTDFHSAPMCTPTRGQLLTGWDALHNGATSVTAGRAIVRRGIPMMPELFRASGYATGVFGKWHVGDTYPYRPMDRGFDVAKYHHGFGISSAVELGNDYANGRYQDNGVPKKFEGYCTDFWFDEAMRFMGDCASRKKPFFCYLPTNTPHGPAWVDPKYSKPYAGARQAANFFGMISNLNENMAKLETFLEQHGLKENTIYVFLTDNGGTGGVNVFNAGMRGRKTQLYHGGHRVPCFVRWPAGKLKAPSDSSVPAQMQDLLPTLIDLCGLKTPAGARFDGASLAKVLRGEAEQLDDRMLVVQYGQIIKKWESCVIWGKWRLVNGTELYNLQEDPAEKQDVAAQNEGVVQKMRAHYEAWWSRVEPALREYVPVVVGAPHQNPVHLCSADWQDIYCDNPNAVLSGAAGPQGGPWNILVDRDGEYEIALARWPFHDPLPLHASRPPQKLTYGALPEGKAFPIAGAKLTVAGQDLTAKAKLGDASVVFRVRLKAGTRTQMHGWFQDETGTDLCGAYYARVRRV